MQGHQAGHGDNRQSLYLWDMKPEGGGPPIKLVVSSIDAKEWVALDPKRYQHDHDGKPRTRIV